MAKQALVNMGAAPNNENVLWIYKRTLIQEGGRL